MPSSRAIVSKARGDAAPKPKTKRQRAYEAEHADDHDDDDDEHIELPPALARKVVREAQQQQSEMERPGAGIVEKAAVRRPAAGRSKPSARSSRADASDDDDDVIDDDDDDAELAGAPEYYEDVEEVELGADEERALELFMGGGKSRNLADIIMEKIAQRNDAMAEGGDGGSAADAAPAPMPELPEKVIEVYQGVGKLLKTYRSGKLPKAFKIVPRLANWEEILYVTRPDDWSPAATREATRLFASNMNSKMAQRFFNLVLLPAVQDDIDQNKRLNFHLYLALKKVRHEARRVAEVSNGAGARAKRQDEEGGAKREGEERQRVHAPSGWPSAISHPEAARAPALPPTP